MTSRSPIYQHAADMHAAMKRDYAVLDEAQYIAAENATRGNLLNRRGREVGVDARSLFQGPLLRAHAYASEELLTWWEVHPRVTVSEFELQWWGDPEGHA